MWRLRVAVFFHGRDRAEPGVIRGPVPTARGRHRDEAGVHGHEACEPRRLPPRALQRLVQVPIGLQPHPKLRQRFQQSRQPQRRIGRDPALAQDDLVQPVERDAQPLRGLDLVDEVLPDRHRIAPQGQRRHHALAMRGTRARTRVGGHLRRNGRFCPSFAGPPAAAHRHVGGLQVLTGRLATDADLTLNAPQRPAQAAQRDDLLLAMCVQDVPHAHAGAQAPRRSQRLGRRPSGNGRVYGVD